jgi:hypothetical protein
MVCNQGNNGVKGWDFTAITRLPSPEDDANYKLLQNQAPPPGSGI